MENKQKPETERDWYRLIFISGTILTIIAAVIFFIKGLQLIAAS